IVGRLAVGLPNHVDRDDLTSAGIMGLLDAIDKYDLTRGIKFETYATARVRGSILDFLRAQDWIPVSLRQKAKKLEALFADLEQKFSRPPTDAEMAAALEIEVADYYGLLKDINGYSLLSLDEMAGNAWLVDEHEDSSPSRLAECAEVKKIMAAAIERLPEKERLVVALYYYEGLTLKEIGVTLGLSEGRISQLHTKAILRLRGALSRKKNMFFEGLLNRGR
ncbi:MAG TPA: FliA/WhiG family RNA polymerase sigma factor, partial [Firmicutes bacterium]|nr:FliA/WhiG family RNA polymerase sigma factor [Bacillota bacterium]